MKLYEFFTNTNPIIIKEGGNIFKGDLETVRINQADVLPTVEWLEKITRLPLSNNMLGTTGKKSSSGDLDLAVDETAIDKNELTNRLKTAAQKLGMDPDATVKKSGVSVHFRTPINGTGENGFVQTDFMFTSDLNWMQFVMSASANSQFKGIHRAQMLASIAKAMGYKVTPKFGLVNRETNEPVTKDPDQIAKMLLNQSATADDLVSVETMLAALKNDPDREAKIADAKETFSREGITLPESANESVELEEGLLSNIVGLIGAYYGVQLGIPDAIMNTMDMPMGTYKLTQHLLGGAVGFVAGNAVGNAAVSGTKKLLVRMVGAAIKKTVQKIKSGTPEEEAWKQYETVVKEQYEKIMQSAVTGGKKEPTLFNKNQQQNEAKKISAKDDPCWKGYHMVGTKKKGGKEVPNCVPGKKG